MAIPKRTYREGVDLSVIGLGGILVVGMEQRDADAVVAEAVERGVNYFDVAPSYGNGEAEEKLGPALAPYRDRVFLACKTLERSAEGARRELETSLKRLRTDHLDLYQFHALNRPEEMDQVLARGGAAEVFLDARERGLVRFLGFSSHVEETAMAFLERFPADSVLFPISVGCWAHGGFGSRLIERARARGVARLALKALARTVVPKGAPKRYSKCWYEPFDASDEIRDALRFTLSQDVTAAVMPGHVSLFRAAMDAAERLSPLSEEERGALLQRAAERQPIFPTESGT